MILVKRRFPIHDRLRAVFFILCSLLLQVVVIAQGDSLRSTRAGQPLIIRINPDSTILLTSTPEEQRFSIRNSTQSTDTVLDNLHNYYQTGVLGNIGLPSYSLLANNTYANNDNGFFKWMTLNNQNDLFTSKQPVYFYPQGKVYTKIFAAMGQKQEQVFKILHSQNIGRVNISLRFNRYSCIGFYQNQKSLTDNVLFSSHATTKNGRLGYNFYFLFNKLKYQLNGGIDTSKVNFEKNVLAQKQLFPVLLSATKQNVRTLEANFHTFFRLNENDKRAAHTLNYEVNYQGNYWLNNESLSDTIRYGSTYFYPTNAVTITDSTSFKRLNNSFYYRMNDRELINLFFGYKNEFNHYRRTFLDSIAMNHIAMYGFSSANEREWVSVIGQNVVSGANAGNYNYDFSAGGKLKGFYLDISGNLSKQKPSLMNITYFSPHFAWNNAFHNIENFSGKFELGSEKYRFKIGASVQQVKHFIYYDTSALPQQYDSALTISRFYAEKDLKLGPIHFNNILNYQLVSNTAVMRLPQYYTFHQLYYEGKLFKKALWLQVGVQARYVSAFKANAYMPSTNQFYLQNEKEYGNYVFVDVFLNAQIDRFRFFLLASHINQGLSGASYMLAPNYAMPDRSLKAGLCWMFFD